MGLWIALLCFGVLILLPNFALAMVQFTLRLIAALFLFLILLAIIVVPLMPHM